MIFGFSSMFILYVRSARQKIIPAEDYGKTLGVIILFNSLTMPISGLLVGLVSSVEYTGWLILAVAMFVACTGLALSLASGTAPQAEVSETP